MDKVEILKWLERYNYSYPPSRYTINKDMSIDVKGSISLNKIPGDRLPTGIKFNIIDGDFDCSENELVTLEGCPKEVSGGFYCYGNLLKTLESAPEKVGSYFCCYSNDLISLKGAPKVVSGTFDCANNKLVSIKYAPKEVGGVFDCGDNKLTSLEGCPEKVGGPFYCLNNKLDNLKYMPALKAECHTDFTKEEVKIEQDIMKQAKSYKEGVQAYQEYLDIFGDD